MQKLRLLHLALLPIALALFFFSFIFYSQSAYAQSGYQQISTFNATFAQANYTLTNATAYVTMVNQSAYLIFYPNLSKAYAYLQTANELVKASPSASIENSNAAVDIAKIQYSNISFYRRISLIIMLLITGGLALILHEYMKPVPRNKASKRRRS